MESAVPLETRESTDTPVISLFWTGGWDSTFRLLYLLLVEEKMVRPYYVIDTDRKSTLSELKARETIRSELFKRHPKTEKLLLPTTVVLKTDIKPNETIMHQYRRLTSAIHIGTQYEWLARFADEVGLCDVEICVERTLPGFGELVPLIAPELRGEGHDCQLRDHPGNDDLDLFGRFRFSTIHLTKSEMKQLSEQHGFDDILRNAWFCHSPTKDGLPCGECIPCQQARQSGWEHRYARRSPISRVRCRANSLIQEARQTLDRRSPS